MTITERGSQIHVANLPQNRVNWVKLIEFQDIRFSMLEYPMRRYTFGILDMLVCTFPIYSDIILLTDQPAASTAAITYEF